MDPKKKVELRKFLSMIADPNLRHFLDLGKLVNSGIYNLSVKMGTEHALSHGDYGYLNQMFGVLDGSPYESLFVASLRSKLNFIITEGTPRKLKKATPEQIADAAERAGKRQAAVVKAIPTKTPKTRAIKAKGPKSIRSEDLLDSRLRLPGSYGTGKRR